MTLRLQFIGDSWPAVVEGGCVTVGVEQRVVDPVEVPHLSSRVLTGSGSGGQASVELVAVMPLLAISALLCFHLALAGWALWSAEEAARVASRADAVELDAKSRALAALPGVFRPDASVSVAEGRARVEVSIPTLAPGISLPRIGAEAGPVAPMAVVPDGLAPSGV